MTKKRGFTLVELSLAIAFISILSIAVTLIITSSISSYHRGITLNKINTTGMDLVDDIRSAIQSSPATKISNLCSGSEYFTGAERKACENDQGQNFVSVTRKANVFIDGKPIEETPVYGALCTGEYSYIWNSGYFFGEGYTVGSNPDNPLSSATFSYKIAGNNNKQEKVDFKLLKVKDKKRKICISAVIKSNENKPKYEINTSTNPLTNEFDISNDQSLVLEEDPIELLSSDIENNLALYSLYAASPAEDSANTVALYSVSFILGTLQGGINVKASGDYCDPPKSYSSVENFDYCAINKFNFAALATGGENK